MEFYFTLSVGTLFFTIQLYLFISQYIKVIFVKRSPFLILGSADQENTTPFRYLKSFSRKGVLCAI